MKLELKNGSTAEIKFFHRSVEKAHPGNPGILQPKGTGCSVEIFTDGSEKPTISAEAESILHPKDSYSKAKGRKIALSKAMKSIDMDKDLRTQIWDALFEAGISK